MPAQDNPTLSKTLRDEIAKLDGVAITDRSRYYTVTKNETTVAWVTPQARAQRVDFPAADGKTVVASKTISVKEQKQIAPAVAKIAAAAKKVK